MYNTHFIFIIIIILNFLLYNRNTRNAGVEALNAARLSVD